MKWMTSLGDRLGSHPTMYGSLAVLEEALGQSPTALGRYLRTALRMRGSLQPTGQNHRRSGLYPMDLVAVREYLNYRLKVGGST